MRNAVYEIEWRELLVKRLKAVQFVLRRDAATEKKQRTEAKQIAAGYPTYEEAHEAYGWGYITEKQLDNIKAIFEDQESPTKEALRRLGQMIGSVEGEISMLRHDPDYRKEIVPEYGVAQSGLSPA